MRKNSVRGQRYPAAAIDLQDFYVSIDMSSASDVGNVAGIRDQIDLSEEARLVQLKRIEELKGRIGDTPIARNETNSNYQTYDPMICDQTPLSVTNTISTPDIIQGPSLLSKQPCSSTRSQRSWDSMAHDIECDDDQSSIKVLFAGNNEMCPSNNSIGLGISQQDEIGSKTVTMDISDDGSAQSQRMGSTPSKASRLSSNISAQTTETNFESNKSPAVIHSNDLSSISSISPQLSPLISAMPHADIQPLKDATTTQRRRSSVKVPKPRFSEYRPRTAIPSNLQHAELARQSVEAALASRLNPFVLHPDEHRILRSHICETHVSAYLNIRNRILRLWVRNPMVSVTAEEAAGCAYSSRWLGLGEVAYEWLIRRGYINFGCVDIPTSSSGRKRSTLKRAKKTIVVVGAGMAGLGCARQLDGLFRHYRDVWTLAGAQPPEVIILEGRPRLGGRIYSHSLRNQTSINIPEHSRCTAEMGAHIITGFNNGNPLNIIIRGQLALDHHPLKDNSSLYDIDGQIVDRDRDKMVEKLFNDILDRASVYRHRNPIISTAEGNRQLIEAGRDPTSDAGKLLATVEDEENVARQETSALNGNSEEGIAGANKLEGKAHLVMSSRAKELPVLAARSMGWNIAPSVSPFQEISLDEAIQSLARPSLGTVMDAAVRQYQSFLGFTSQDLRLLNWHFANLEYANAANVGKLSLGGWDQDVGNEFEGEHAQVIGGYQQVPRAIWHYPSKLALRTRKVVKRIAYDPKEEPKSGAKVTCEDGEVLEADHIVLTTPLGVLKDRSITFKPELPTWKLDSIRQLGFGTLNKVILVYDEPFWDVHQDMIGLLRDATVTGSKDHYDYARNRGRFYLFWNCIKTSGRPVLIALMAGDAAHQAEVLTDHEIVSEVTQQLDNMFKQTTIPKPAETIVTRWGKDRFARGSYSYVGPEAQSSDYDNMAKSIGNLHFAGEATCGSHPATVHGAYISGLRAASEVIEDLLGPIVIPEPLVPPATVKGTHIPTTATVSPSGAPLPLTESAIDREARLEAYEFEILQAIFAKLGPRPDKPGKAGSNPFLLFSKAKWGECKAKCDDSRQIATGNPQAKATRNEVRAALGLMWRGARNDEKQPYIDQTTSNRANNQENAATFQHRLAAWDAEAMATRREYVEQHPDVLSHEEETAMWQALGVFVEVDRAAKRVSGFTDGGTVAMEE